MEDTPEAYRAHMEERATRILDQAGRVAAAAGVAFEARHVEDDQPYRAIIREAEENGCDLIAMASHGLRGMSTLVLGSETVKVLTHTSIPVLVYRAVELHGGRRSHEGRKDPIRDDRLSGALSRDTAGAAQGSLELRDLEESRCTRIIQLTGECRSHRLPACTPPRARDRDSPQAQSQGLPRLMQVDEPWS